MWKWQKLWVHYLQCHIFDPLTVEVVHILRHLSISFSLMFALSVSCAVNKSKLWQNSVMMKCCRAAKILMWENPNNCHTIRILIVFKVKMKVVMMYLIHIMQLYVRLTLEVVCRRSPSVSSFITLPLSSLLCSPQDEVAHTLTESRVLKNTRHPFLTVSISVYTAWNILNSVC